jgi:hypothetical protein
VAGLAAALAAALVATLFGWLPFPASEGSQNPGLAPEGAAGAPSATRDASIGLAAGVAFNHPPGQVFALPTPLDGPQAAPLLASPTSGLTEFVREHSGAAVSPLNAAIVLTGTSDRPTRLTELRIHRTTSAENYSGTAIYTSSAGDRPTIPLTADLDRGVPELLGESGRPYFLDHNIEVTRDERETFAIQFTAEQYSHQWIIAVDYVSEHGTIETLYLDTLGELHSAPASIPPDQQFAITGPAQSYAIEYSDNYPLGDGFHPAYPSPSSSP